MGVVALMHVYRGALYRVAPAYASHAAGNRGGEDAGCDSGREAPFGPQLLRSKYIIAVDEQQQQQHVFETALMEDYRRKVIHIQDVKFC